MNSMGWVLDLLNCPNQALFRHVRGMHLFSVPEHTIFVLEVNEKRNYIIAINGRSNGKRKVLVSL